jgi:hypothetical protein
MKTPQDPEAAETVQTTNVPAVAPAATCSASLECKCWEETDAKLREHGYKLSDALSCLQWSQSRPMTVTHLLPLQRVDGKKLKRGEPGSINISHCPFCGNKYRHNS